MIDSTIPAIASACGLAPEVVFAVDVDADGAGVHVALSDHKRGGEFYLLTELDLAVDFVTGRIDIGLLVDPRNFCVSSKEKRISAHMDRKRNGWMGVVRATRGATAVALLTFVAADLSAQSTSEMKQAKQGEFELLDKKLNEVFDRVLANQDEPGKTKLKTAQNAWIKFRDAEAEFAAHSEAEGTAAPLVYIQSQIEQTKLRLEQLKSY